jgi:hypothetical protein
MMWSERRENEIYVYWNGVLVYKRWLKPNGEKAASILLNEIWPNVRLPRDK